MRLLLFLVWPTLTAAIHLLFASRSFVEHKSVDNNPLAASGNDKITLVSTRDIIYIANVTIEGNIYPLQIDTGSSDLWVDLGSNRPSNPTNITTNIIYGIGNTFGRIARGPVSFAGYDIPDQAYLQFQNGSNPVFVLGAKGIVGLGSTSLSLIDAVVKNTTNTWGQSLLYNIFSLYPSKPNFIAMSLGRSVDTVSAVGGSLGIGEVDPEYSNVTGTDHIPLFPPNSRRWSVLSDSYAIHGMKQDLVSTVPNVPSGKANVLLDSGTSFVFAPPQVAKDIYSSVPGAFLNTTTNQWSVPCDSEISVTLWIGGRPFDIHPLDVVVPSLIERDECIGSFLPGQLSGVDDLDWIIGASVLRSIYAVYDFGDFDSNNKMGAPYVQLLSIVDTDKASLDFISIRRGAADLSNSSQTANVKKTFEARHTRTSSSVMVILFALLFVDI